MSLIQCPDCSARISNHAPRCPRCGRPSRGGSIQTVQQTAKKHKACQAIGLLVLFVSTFAAVTVVSIAPQYFAITLFLAVLGLVVYAGGRVSAWWHHQ